MTTETENQTQQTQKLSFYKYFYEVELSNCIVSIA